MGTEWVFDARCPVCSTHMTASIKIPVAIYHGFMGRCPFASREYKILKTSLINHVPNGHGNNFEFLCGIDDAKLLFNHARLFYPEAVAYIEDGISLLRPRNTVALLRSLDEGSSVE